jgi:hypothetical protein
MTDLNHLPVHSQRIAIGNAFESLPNTKMIISKRFLDYCILNHLEIVKEFLNNPDLAPNDLLGMENICKVRREIARTA